MADQEMDNLDSQLEVSNFFQRISRGFIKLTQVQTPLNRRFLSHSMK